MWQKSTIKLSEKMKSALQSQGGNSIDLKTTGLLICTDNWSDGIEENGEFYLSPNNAISSLSNQVNINGNAEVLCFLIAENNIQTFISKLETICNLLPYPHFKRSFEYAKSQKDLSKTQMIKEEGSSSINKAADISPSPNRTVNKILRNHTASNVAQTIVNPLNALAEIKSKKAEKEKANNDKMQKMAQSSVKIFTFSHSGEVGQGLKTIEKQIPNPTAVFTTAILFIGKNLNNIKELIHDE